MFIYDETEFTPEDMQRKFGDTYIRLKNIGVVYMRSFFDNNFIVRHSSGKEEVFESKDFIVEQEFPEVGIMVNYKHWANIVARVPRRQWRAGLCVDSLQFGTGPHGNRALGDNLGWGLVKALFDPEYPDLNFAFHKVKADNRTSCAFTKDFWFFNEAGTIKLLHKKVCLGKITLEDKIFKLDLYNHALSYEQELKDNFKGDNFVIERSLQE